MEQTQLVELLRTLDQSERQQLMDFAQAPSLNNGRFQARVILLLELCLDFNWANSSLSLSKEQHTPMYSRAKLMWTEN
jgi:hypothetical protein